MKTPALLRTLLTFLAVVPMASPSVSAITLPLSDFPQAIQDGVAGGATLNTSTGLEWQGRSAFVYVTGGGSFEWLLRFPLDSASRQVAATDDGSGNWTTVTTPLTGYIWLEAPTSLPPDPVPFTLYTDFVTPVPQNLWLGGNGGPNLPMTMPQADALGGGASFVSGLDANNVPYTSGSLRTVGDFGGEGLIPCADADCEVSAELNLVGLDVGTTLSLNLTDPRPLLYRQNSRYPGGGGWDTTQSYYVAPVPEPVSVALVAGSLGVLWLRRRMARR